MASEMESPKPVKYAIYFYPGDQGSEKRYLFVRKLYRGSQAATQLVWDAEAKELLVRKAGRRHPELDQMNEETEFVQQLLQKERLEKAEELGLVPRIPRVCASGDRPGEFQEQDKHKGICYYSLCNGGDLYFFQKKYPSWRTRDTKIPSFPALLLVRFIHQMCQNLQFLYKSIPEEPIYHLDLAAANVFVHWADKQPETLPDFFLGDFGLAKVTVQNRTSAMARFVKWDVDALLSIVIEILDYTEEEWNELITTSGKLGPIGDVLRELTRLNESYEAQKLRINPDGSVQIPDLSEVIEMAKNAEETYAAEEKTWKFRFEHKRSVRIGGVKLEKATWDTESEAVAAGTVIEYGDEDKSGIRFETDNEFDSDESERDRAMASFEEENDSDSDDEGEAPGEDGEDEEPGNDDDDGDDGEGEKEPSDEDEKEQEG